MPGDIMCPGEEGEAGNTMAGEEKPRRLCSEIQLFDLCEKTKCNKKDGRFCSDDLLVAKFEAISQEDDFPPDRYDGEEPEGGDEDELEGYGGGFGAEADEEDDYEEES